MLKGMISALLALVPMTVLLALLFPPNVMGTDRPNEPVAVTEVRALLDAGDVAGLETAMARLATVAAGTHGYDDLRAIHTRLFETTHPARRVTIAAWRTAYPDSPYAATAEAFAKIREVEMWSNMPDGYGNRNPNPTGAAWSEAREAALAAVDTALERAATSYVPVFDVWFRSRAFNREYDQFGLYAELLMAEAPGRTSLRAILDSVAGWARFDAEQVLVVCSTFALDLADYDPDLCVMETALHHYLGEQITAQAKEMVLTLDDPRFTSEKLEAMTLLGGRDPQQVDTWIALHRAALGPETDIAAYVRKAEFISTVGNRPDYRAEWRVLVLAELDRRLSDDPLNRKLLKVKSQMYAGVFHDTSSPDDLAAARAAWELAMVYGEQDVKLWRLGATIASFGVAPGKEDGQFALWGNAIALSQQGVMYVLEQLYFLDQPGAKAAMAGDWAPAADDPLLCGKIRAARLAQALCREEPESSQICDPARPLYATVPGLLKAAADGACPDVGSASLSQLAYRQIPLSEIVLPW